MGRLVSLRAFSSFFLIFDMRFTSIKESEKLIDLGLSKETADMYYFADPTPIGTVYIPKISTILPGLKSVPEYSEGDIPAWSLEGLLEIIKSKTKVSIIIKDETYTISVYIKDDKITQYISGASLFEAALETIIFILNNKL